MLSTDIVNARRRTVVVVPISSSPRPAPPLAVAVSVQGRSSVAVIDQIRAVTKERLHRNAGLVSDAELGAIEEALRTVLEL